MQIPTASPLYPAKEGRGDSFKKDMITIPVRDLASFDEAGSQWVADAGTYTFLVGDNVEDIKGKTTLQLGAYSEKTNKALAMKEKLNLLHQ